MRFSLKQKLQLTQQQALESAKQTYLQAPIPLGAGFETWLLLRLKIFKASSKVSAILAQAPQWYANIKTVLLLLGLICGAGSVAAMLPGQQQQVNLFWLLTALLGAHSFALLLWLLFVALLRSHNNGVIATALNWVVNKMMGLKKLNEESQLALGSWWQALLQPKLRPWQLGLFTHLFWLAFLLGSALALIGILTTQQFDFVWESTLLSDSQLSAILAALAAPQQLFGLGIPDSAQTAAQQRRAWAIFILLATALYALLPRLIALLITAATLRWQQAQWQLDFSQSYFIHLQNQFHHQQQRPMILDHDPAPPTASEQETSFAEVLPPEQAWWYGLEIGNAVDLEQRLPNFKGYINSLHEAQALLETKRPKNPPLAFFVEGHRVADRGQQRILKLLLKGKNWLVIMRTEQTESEHLQQWQRVADDLQWPSERRALVSAA